MNCLLRLLVVIGLLGGMAFSQTLGDVARQNRQTKRKPAAHVYTNDDIPAATLKEASAKATDADAKTDDASKDAAAGKPSDKTTTENGDKKSGDPDEATRKKWDDYKKRVADQKATIDLLQREVDVLQKEQQIQIAEYYSDAGNRLRDTKAWAEQQQKNQDKIDAKSKDLQDARDALVALQDEGKKENVPASYLE